MKPRHILLVTTGISAIVIGTLSNDQPIVHLIAIIGLLMLASIAVIPTILRKTTTIGSSMVITSKIWMTAVVGYLFGTGRWGLALSVAIAALGLYLIHKKYKSTQQEYSMVIQTSKPSLIAKLSELISKFNLQPTKKSIDFQNSVRIHLDYETTPAIQYVFLRRLSKLNGIHYQTHL